MEEALLMAKAKDTKERMAGVEWLHELLEASRKSLSSSEVTALIDCCMDLLKDNNFRVSQGALQVLSSAVVLSGEYFKLHFNGLVPAVVEKLGDGKQPVRDAARQLLVTLMEVSSPTIIVERAGSYAWSHKRWRVREEFARTVSAAVGLFASTELPLQRVLLPPVLQLLNDPNQSVKDAATSCIEEMYSQAGSQFRDELQRYHLPLPMMKEINSRLELIEPKVKSSYARESPFNHTEMKSTSHTKKRTSPKVKITQQEISPAAGENDVTEKNIDPIIVYSEKELFREFEKIASNLVPEKDWSVRIAAMQRIEGLVFGGAMDYPSFLMILKQLVSPLSSQLSDRRSSIVKQACHLLNLLSKELLGDFETCAEMFIPVLFKLVVITVLVIAESADNCIKTMLRNCKVSRVLSRIAVCAKNDRSAVLRARCCEYALLILEYWADAPEIQRSADLYEDLIKCCVADAMSEVRSTARTCYRMFSKTWPERSRRLFLSFDPVIQRIINDEDGGMHKRYTSPSLRERGVQFSRAPFQSATSISGFGTSAIVAMDRSATISSGTSLSANNLCMSQTKTPGEGSVRNIESVLHASKQKVTAIESLLKGVNLSEGTNSFTTVPNLGVNYPSSRNQLFTPALTQHVSRNASLIDSVSTNITRNSSESLYPSNMTSNSLPSLSSRLMVRRSADRVHDNGSFDANDSHGSHVPNFQRPLLRKQATSRNANSRKSFDDSQFFSSQITGSYMDGPTSLNDALMEGLSPNSDWVARVSAFNYLRALLQKGPKSIQEVMQSFEKVMKLFLQHLDDRHHKVAQAALSTLAEIIPACRKPFESYLERTLPHVFSHLIDPKELVRKPCSATLEVVSRTYGIESLLPALLRSLDEQRSPKAKLAVIEFANNSFNKHGTNSEGPGNSGYLKLWLSKLLPLINEKNTKLKESAIAGYISVYSHFDSVAVLNFIIGLSVETQNALRRALKQFTPRIEVDLMSFLQNKKERQQRQRLSYDQSDVGTSSEEGYVGSSKKSMFFGRYSAGAHDNDSSGKWNFVQEISNFSGSVEQDVFDENQEHYNPNYSVNPDNEILLNSKVNNFKYNAGISMDTNALSNFSEKTDLEIEFQSSVGNPKPNNDVLQHDGQRNIGVSVVDETLQNIQHEKKIIQKNESSIPQLLHQICFDGNSSEIKHEALHCLMEASKSNDHSMWTKYFSQILTAMLKVLDDPDPSIRELVLSLIVEMMKNDNVKDSIEMVLEKLLHSTKDVVAKVTNETHHCLNILLSECDPHRCLTVVEPLLLCEDEKMLVTSVNCLTKLVTRLSQVELMTELPSFLPALFDAFGNPSVDVRKSVVFCLVDIYIMLDQEFLPYLEGLNSTQLQLVTLYANRISQARSGSEIDSSNHH